MKARFDDQLKLGADGRKLEACGPLDWNDPDGPQNVNKVKVKVTITQGDAVAEGTTEEFARGVTEWMINLKPGPSQKFQAGEAEAIGTLIVIDPAPSGATAGPEFTWGGQPALAFDPNVS